MSTEQSGGIDHADDDDAGALEQSRGVADALELSGGEDATNHADDDDAGALDQSSDVADALELSGGEDAANRADEDDAGALEQSGGEDAANRADGNDAGTGGEDHLSALPDDVLLLILLHLNSTSDAARTGVLSRRWRHIWTLLPLLQFGPSIDPHSLRRLLSANELPLLRTLLVVQRNASPEFPAALLPDAARRVSGDLTIINVKDRKADCDAEASQGETFEFPCFEKATSICLLGYLSLSVSPAGVFARLTDLSLGDVWFYGPGELGDAVSSQRLQKLCIVNIKGLDNISINSRSLQLINLQIIPRLRQITVVAPALRDFILVKCFYYDRNQPVVNISVPQLKSLNWCDSYAQSSVDLGSMNHLQTVETSFVVYGLDKFTDNSACLVLLPRFEVIRNLVLSLIYPREIIHHLQYMMEGMTKLPDATSLRLNVKAEGHLFGASAFHVLKFCPGIKTLILVLCEPLLSKFQVPPACSSGCICDQQTNWKTDEISLNHLQELEIKEFRALEHDVAFVKRLLNWVAVLKMMTVTFDCSVTESKAKELILMFQGFCRPDVSMKYYIEKAQTEWPSGGISAYIGR